MPRIGENDLIIPTLKLLNTANNNTLTTTELIQKLTVKMNPSKEDLVILKDRNDSKFSQIVRNLKSHDTFNELGYAKYTPPLSKRESGSFTITDKGKKYLQLVQ